jgi:hypothetical protein
MKNNPAALTHPDMVHLDITSLAPADEHNLKAGRVRI